MESNNSHKRENLGNVKIEVQNYPGIRKYFCWRTDNSMKTRLNNLWKKLDKKTEGLLEMVFTSDAGVHIMVNCGNIIWTAYNGLVVMRKGNTSMFRFDGNEKFRNEIFKTVPNEHFEYIKPSATELWTNYNEKQIA